MDFAKLKVEAAEVGGKVFLNDVDISGFTSAVLIQTSGGNLTQAMLILNAECEIEAEVKMPEGLEVVKVSAAPGDLVATMNRYARRFKDRAPGMPDVDRPE